MMRSLVGVLFPLVCPGCEQRVPSGAPVCDTCRADCVPPVPAAPPDGVDAWVAPFAYTGVTREVVARVKYRASHGATPWLADAMAAAWRAAAGARPESSIAAVTWAPTTSDRRRERGFDHAELLARAVARRLGRPARPMLARVASPPQTGRTGAERRRGPEFRVTGPVPIGRVLLVDDVATTGATLRAGATALRAAGATAVVALTAARTPPVTAMMRG
jgi:ComF family protein